MTKAPGVYRTVGWIPGNFFADGTYVVTVAISSRDPLDYHVVERDAVAFHVIDTTDEDLARGTFPGTMAGLLRPMLEWKTTRASSTLQAADGDLRH